MGAYVSVESFEALKRLRTALCRFAEVVSAGLGESDAELQRAQHWVQPEQSNYWKREGVKRRELLGRAKSALAFKKMQTTSSGSRPSCVEEENALALAKRRLEEAEQKLANVRSWSHRLDDEIHSYQAVTSGLNLALTVDLPKAITQLDNMLAALEAYAPSAAPQVQGSSAAVGAEAVPDAEDKRLVEGGARRDSRTSPGRDSRTRTP